MNALLIVLILGMVATGCTREGAEASAPHDPPASLAACKVDADCYAPPCGPCTANTIITSEMMNQECVVNPCHSPSAWCTPRHVCAVK